MAGRRGGGRRGISVLGNFATGSRSRKRGTGPALREAHVHDPADAQEGPALHNRLVRVSCHLSDAGLPAPVPPAGLRHRVHRHGRRHRHSGSGLSTSSVLDRRKDPPEVAPSDRELRLLPDGLRTLACPPSRRGSLRHPAPRHVHPDDHGGPATRPAFLFGDLNNVPPEVGSIGNLSPTNRAATAAPALRNAPTSRAFRYRLPARTRPPLRRPSSPRATAPTSTR